MSGTKFTINYSQITLIFMTLICIQSKSIIIPLTDIILLFSILEPWLYIINNYWCFKMINRLKGILNIQLSHLTIDWLGCLSLFVLTALLEIYIPPFQREFSLTDPTIQHSFTINEIVPTWMFFVLSLILPIIVIFLSIIQVKNFKKVHLALIGVTFSWCLSNVITQFLKNMVGRLRPDFIARCQPSEEIMNQSQHLYKLVTSAICTQQDYWLLRGGSQSFPSGHTSASFAGLGFLSLYLAHILKLNHKRVRLLEYYSVLLPLGLATFIGVSRISDYRHHWQDVTIGMIIGCFTTCFSYYHYFKRHIPLIEMNQSADSYQPID